MWDYSIILLNWVFAWKIGVEMYIKGEICEIFVKRYYTAEIRKKKINSKKKKLLSNRSKKWLQLQFEMHSIRQKITTQSLYLWWPLSQNAFSYAFVHNFCYNFEMLQYFLLKFGPQIGKDMINKLIEYFHIMISCF